jgi:hypothetical protein
MHHPPTSVRACALVLAAVLEACFSSVGPPLPPDWDGAEDGRDGAGDGRDAPGDREAESRDELPGEESWCDMNPPLPEDTTCDGVDDDCDGKLDDDFEPTTCGVGACEAESVCEHDEETCVPGDPVPEVCDGIDNDCDGNVDNGVCTTIRVRAEYWPNTDTLDRYHQVSIDCMSHLNQGCRVESGCTTESCTDGKRCALGISAGAQDKTFDFTGVSNGPHTICYCASSPPGTGYTWNANLYIMEGGAWVNKGSSSGVTWGSWLCTSNVYPQ